MNKTGKQTVLIVDDMPENIDLLSSLLTPFYKVKVANNGERALKIAIQSLPEIILLDIMMPDMDGYEVCHLLKQEPRTRPIPVIFITAMTGIEEEKRGFELGAVDYITKPLSPPIVLARVRTQLQIYDQNRALEEKVKQRTSELDQSRLEIIRRLGRAAEYRDNETGLHVIRMSYYSRIIAKGIGMDDNEADIILNAAPMHDVGKIGIPDTILLKPGPLDDAERTIMQKHAEFGAEIIGEHENILLKSARSAALTHHERWDGKGYPAGLAGEDIPVIGRILAIADVFDALLSDRPYKKAWPLERALELMRNEAGSHFDPQLVRVFMNGIDEVKEIMKTHADRD